MVPSLVRIISKEKYAEMPSSQLSHIPRKNQFESSIWIVHIGHEPYLTFLMKHVLQTNPIMIVRALKMSSAAQSKFFISIQTSCLLSLPEFAIYPTHAYPWSFFFRISRSSHSWGSRICSKVNWKISQVSSKQYLSSNMKCFPRLECSSSAHGRLPANPDLSLFPIFIRTGILSSHLWPHNLHHIIV